MNVYIGNKAMRMKIFRINNIIETNNQTNNIETINKFMEDKEVYSIVPLGNDKVIIQYKES